MTPQQIRRVCEANFDVITERSTADELVIICPEPGCGDHSGNRSVNLKTGMTNCWRCGAIKGHRGPLQHWLKHLGIDTGDLTVDIDTTQDVSTLSLSDGKLAPNFVVEVPLPRGFTLLSDDRKSVYWRLIKGMAEKKHLAITDFERVGVGFTRDSPAWEPFAIFPVVEWGRTVYYQGRLYGTAPEGMKGTKKFPSKKLLPVGARNWVYNIDKAREFKPGTLVIVESILNVLSFEKEAARQGISSTEAVAVAVFKHAISREQLDKLLGLKSVHEIVLLFDSDAMASAWESAVDLCALRTVTVCTMPDGVDANDDAVAAVAAYRTRKTINPGNVLEAKLRYSLDV